MVRLALATADFEVGERGVVDQLRPLVKSHPDLVGAQTMLGEILAYSSTDEDFAEWHRTLPPAISRDPDIWYVRGLWARGKADFPLASRCLREALSIAPLHRRACYSLAQVQQSLAAPDAEAIKSQSELMLILSQVVDDVLRSDGQNEHCLLYTSPSPRDS